MASIHDHVIPRSSETRRFTGGGRLRDPGTSSSSPSVTVESAGSARRVPAAGLPPMDPGSGTNPRAGVESRPEPYRTGLPAVAHQSPGLLLAVGFAEHREWQVHRVGGEVAPQRVPGPSAPALRSRAPVGPVPPEVRLGAADAPRGIPRRGQDGRCPTPGFASRASSDTATAGPVTGVTCSRPVFSCLARRRASRPSKPMSNRRS